MFRLFCFIRNGYVDLILDTSSVIMNIKAFFDTIVLLIIEERSFIYMVSSQLIPIIRRLDAMRVDKTGKIQKRRFNVNGDERCLVVFNGLTGKYKLIDRLSDDEYEFDDIDYLSVEILELLQPRKAEYLVQEEEPVC